MCSSDLDGDEYTVMVQDTQPTQETNKLWIPIQAGVVQEVPTVQEMNAAIAGIQAPVADVRVNESSVVSDGVAVIPIAAGSMLGLVKSSTTKGTVIASDGTMQVSDGSVDAMKAGSDRYAIVSARRVNAAAFYGLAKAAGDTTQSQSSNSVGTYTDEAKAAIQQMLDVPSNADIAAKQDALTFDSTPTANSTNPVTSGGVYNAIANVNTMKIHICAQAEYDAETGVPTIQNPDTQTFYLVPGGEGNNLFIEWAYVNGAWERFGSADIEVPVNDVQVNGVSVLDAQGVANVPIANGVLGVVYVPTSGTYGIGMNSASGILQTKLATNIKLGTEYYKPVVPYLQHETVYYGLAKAAGADMKNVSGETIGIYPEAQKSAIHEMLNGSVSVTGTTPTITALSGIQYVCGEVSTLDIVLPASGIVDVVFTSGSTPTVLTITPQTGMTVEWANGFDSTSLEADTLYELNIRMVGTKCLGVAGSWS